MRNLTKSQKAALAGKGKLVLAGAGSGKTTVLTEKYVALLENSDFHPRDLVAMTFSRKAAANLQAKIHAALLQRQRTDSAREEHWRAQRDRMPWARIGTIHSICAGMLRAFPLEAEVDPDFTMSERADDRDDALQQRLRRLAWKRDPDYAAMLELFSKRTSVARLARLIMDRPDIVAAIRNAERDPEGAARFLDEAYARGYAGLRLDAGTPSSEAHARFIDSVVRLLHVVDPLLRAEGQAAKQLTFDDIEFHALRLLEKGSAAAKRIRDSIRFLLVDEFQDTSTRQWRLIRSLVRNEDGDLDLDRLFVVGDDKQSIYGFRSADVTVVESARRVFERSGRPEEEWFVRLNDNFRTVPEVLRPLNEIFDRLLPKNRADALPFEALSGALESKRRTPDGVSPTIELKLGIGREPEEVFAWLAKRLRSELGTLMIADPEDEEGERIRALRPEDVGILLRTRTRQPLLEKALRDAGIPFRVSGGRGFMQQQEVLDLVHLLTALSDPRDQLALVGMLRSPIFNLSDAAVAAIMLTDNDPYRGWRSLAREGEPSAELRSALDEDDRAAIGRSWDLWMQWRALVEHRGPTETLLEALEAGGAWAAYAEGGRGEQRIANIYRFLDFVRVFAEEGNFTLRRLVERIQREMESPGEESEKEAELIAEGGVAVMTIHAAKGLEFPYVILPDLATASRSQGVAELNRGHLLLGEGSYSPLADPGLAELGVQVAGEGVETLHAAMKRDFAPAEEAAERLRLMYVAATRARDHLLMISHVKRGRNKTRGEFFDVSPDSHLGEWMSALGLAISPEGAIEGTRERLLFEVSSLDAEAAAEMESAKAAPEKTPPPQVSLLALPEPDRWRLPFTAFTSWLAKPTDEETLRLIWYTGDARELEAIGEEEAAAVGRDEALLIGDLVHRLYQLHGPGCSWTEVREEVDSELETWSLPRDAETVVRERLRKLIEGGEKLRRIGGENVRRELPIALRVGPVVLRGKADLAWREGKVAHVLDYKTNRLDGKARATTVAEEHGYDHQVRLYGLALLKAWGVREAVCEVAFLDSGETAEYHVTLEDERGYRERADALVARWREVSRKGRRRLEEAEG